MELVFFQADIKHVKKIIDINFYPEYHFRCEAMELFFERKNNFNVFDEDGNHKCNINAIVGKNGTGKTSVIETIINVFLDIQEGYNNLVQDYVMVFLNRKNGIDKFYVYSSNKEVKVPVLQKPEKEQFVINVPMDEQEISVGLIKFSNVFDPYKYSNNSIIKFDNYYDLDLMQCINRDKKRLLEEKRVENTLDDAIRAFGYEETERQINCVMQYEKVIPFKIKDLNVFLSNYDSLIQSYDEQLIGDQLKKEWTENFFDIIERRGNTNEDLEAINQFFDRVNNHLKQHIDKCICDDIDCIINSANTKTIDECKKNFIEFLDKFSVKKRIMHIYCQISEIQEYEVLKYCMRMIIGVILEWSLRQITRQRCELEVYLLTQLFPLIETTIREKGNQCGSKDIFLWLKSFFKKRCVYDEKDTILLTYQKILEFFFNHQNEYDNYNRRFIFNKEHMEEVLEFYSLYRESTAGYSQYLRFEWGMSSGEQSLLSMYARLITAKERMNNQFDNIILIIDDADSYLHPQWQQKLLKLTINFMKSIFKEKKIHLIIATHSPIFLSDIPIQNIISLNGSLKQQTFGANIFDLYNDTFFLNDDNGIGIMGDYARDVIKDINCFLNSVIRLHEMVSVIKESDSDSLPTGLKEKYIKNLQLFHNKVRKKIHYKFMNRIDEIISFILKAVEGLTDKKMLINKINYYLAEETKGELLYCKNIIDQIGEPVIKNGLLSRYYYVMKILGETDQSVSQIIESFLELTMEQQNYVMKMILQNSEK